MNYGENAIKFSTFQNYYIYISINQSNKIHWSDFKNIDIKHFTNFNKKFSFQKSSIYESNIIKSLNKI